MSIDPTHMFASLFVSTIGFAYLVYGRRRPAPMFAIAGFAMMVLSYVVDSAGWMVGLSTLLAVAPFFIG